MSKTRAILFAGCALVLGACSSWPKGAGFGLFDSAPAIPATASIEIDSDPQAVEAKTSIGKNCVTPCVLEVPTSGALSVTFSHDGYLPQTVAVQVQADPETGSVKFTPNPAFAQLTPAKGPKKKPAKPAPTPTAATPGTAVR